MKYKIPVVIKVKANTQEEAFEYADRLLRFGLAITKESEPATHDAIKSVKILKESDMKICKCNNCGWRGAEAEIGVPLKDCKGLGERLNPGSEVPVGECPDCGCLAYHIKDTAASFWFGL